MWEALPLCDHIGLSIDGPNAEVHDKMRGRPGNYRRLLGVLERCTVEGIAVSVRTMVSRGNMDEVHHMAPVMEKYSCIQSWKLLEFTAVELGWDNRDNYQIPTNDFESVLHRTSESYAGRARLEALRTAEKVGGYMMISPAGLIYGVTAQASVQQGRHEFIGSIDSLHLSKIAGEIYIDLANHQKHLHRPAARQQEIISQLNSHHVPDGREKQPALKGFRP